MLLFDLREIGNKIYDLRRRRGLTRAQVAEIAGLSERTYADIERGTVNMRIKTVLGVCEALKANPDEILTVDGVCAAEKEAVLARLAVCTEQETRTALELLSVYLNSIGK